MSSLRGDKGRKSSEMLCKTPIVFDDKYSAMNIPNRATANETRSPNYKGTPFSLGISPDNLGSPTAAIVDLKDPSDLS